VAAVAEQEAAGPTVPAVLAEPPGGAVAAVSPQDAAVLAVGARCRAVGAVADQRAVENRLGGRVDRIERSLLGIGELGAGILSPIAGQQLHKLVVKRRGLSGEGLIQLRVPGKQLGNSCRYIVSARG
jgi:hypothetical protein